MKVIILIINQKYTIQIASLTKEGYGAPKGLYDSLKGENLGRIREKELYRAYAQHRIALAIPRLYIN